MKKYRKCKNRNVRKVRKCSSSKKNLRSGSKAVKTKLLEINPHCDICGSGKSLQLHHIYLIRHGFPTKFEHCCLLCPTCHHDFHHRWDRYLDNVYKQNHEADFLEIYNQLKTL